MSILEEMIEQLAHDLRWRRRACRVLTLGRHWYRADDHEVGIRSLDGLTDEELEEDVGFVTIGAFRQCRGGKPPYKRGRENGPLSISRGSSPVAARV